MTGRELIELIKDNDLEDFEINVSYSYPDGSEWGTTYVSGTIIGIVDIGYSDKSVILDWEE